MQNINRGARSGTPSPTPPGSSSSPTAVTRLQRLDDSIPCFPAHQNSGQPLATELAQRDVYALDTAAGARVPDAQSLCRLLCDLDDHAPVAMGIALGVPSHILLQELGAYDRDPCQLVKSLLAASLPFSLKDVAAWLEEDMALWDGDDVARQIRCLAEYRGIERLHSLEPPLCDELVSVLLPLVADIDWLGEGFGLSRAEVLELQSDSVPPTRYRLTETIIDMDMLLRREQNKPGRTCGEWMKVMAMAGVGVSDLKHLARHWKLAPPPGLASWHAYASTIVHDLQDEVRLWHQLDHSKPVSLQKVVTLLRNSVLFKPCDMRDMQAFNRDRISLPLAVGNASDPRLFTEREWHTLCLYSLLEHAVSQGGDGQHISGALLCRLDRLRLTEGGAAGIPGCTAPAPQTHSRPLCPFDLLRLSQAAHEPERHALEIAAALGVGGDISGGWAGHWSEIWDEDRSSRTQWQALCTWRWIYSRAPWLETGHLVQLFRQFDRDELMQQLTGIGSSDCEFGAAASPFPNQVVAFMGLAKELYHQPELVRAFLLQSSIKQHFGYLMSPNSGNNWRVLNCLAVDPLMQKAWRRFVAACLKNRESAATRKLELNAAGCPHDYLCPISLMYMDDPVVIIESQSNCMYFSRRSLLRALREAGPFNPLTRSPLYPDEVPEVDQEYLARINAWRRQHPELEEAQEEAEV